MHQSVYAHELSDIENVQAVSSYCKKKKGGGEVMINAISTLQLKAKYLLAAEET